MKKDEIRNYKEIVNLLDKNDPINAFVAFVKERYPKLDIDKVQQIIEILYDILKDTNLYKFPFVIVTNLYNSNKDKFKDISLFEFQLSLCLITDFLICSKKKDKKFLWPFLTEEQSDWINKALLLISSVHVKDKNDKLFNKEELDLVSFAEKEKDKFSKKYEDKEYKWQYSNPYAMWSIYNKDIDYNRFIKINKFMDEKSKDVNELFVEISKEDKPKNEIVLMEKINMPITGMGQVQTSKLKTAIVWTLVIGLVGVGGYLIWKSRKGK